MSASCKAMDWSAWSAKDPNHIPRRDKAVLFFEVESVERTVAQCGDRVVGQSKPGDRNRWAVLHDPEGHNVLLMEKSLT